MKLLTADTPSKGFEYMRRSGLLKLALPELDSCFEVDQTDSMLMIFIITVFTPVTQRQRISPL
jgi:tRNA nucleotidyltransferase/poly(A) polymerase